MDNVVAAHTLIRLLDLTSLNDNDSEYKIDELCQKAHSPYGNVAAVCVYPKFVAQARELTVDTEIKVATVVNFPQGEYNLGKLKKEITFAIENGAHEIDAVFPYYEFLNKNYTACENFLTTARELSDGKTLKIILETGELKTAVKITEATDICISHGADFIKTSTGKSKISATPEAANAILEAINRNQANVGFKASGGIRTLDDAKQYLTLATAVMGYKWISPANLRIGASSLLDNLIATIRRGY